MKALLLIALLAVASGPWRVCDASVMRYCDQQAELSASQQDRLIQFAGVVKAALDDSGQSVALIARSGLDLSRFGVRYSHAGLSLKSSNNTPWSVRQLYYACDEQMPRIFDQGTAGFVMGTDDPSIGFVSIVFLPASAAAALEHVALDNRRALQLLGATYSANAYPFSVRYQNCNQWVAELLAAAWGNLDETENLRTEAQRWLRTNGYVPSIFDVGFGPLRWISAFIPWIHGDDHPPADIGQAIYRVSMPASIEAFVRATVVGASRMEFCHANGRVVIRRGWEPIADGCQPGPQDTVVALQ